MNILSLFLSLRKDVVYTSLNKRVAAPLFIIKLTHTDRLYTFSTKNDHNDPSGNFSLAGAGLLVD